MLQIGEALLRTLSERRALPAAPLGYAKGVAERAEREQHERGVLKARSEICIDKRCAHAEVAGSCALRAEGFVYEAVFRKDQSHLAAAGTLDAN
jgi:hypothetical protein